MATNYHGNAILPMIWVYPVSKNCGPFLPLCPHFHSTARAKVKNPKQKVAARKLPEPPKTQEEGPKHPSADEREEEDRSWATDTADRERSGERMKVKEKQKKSLKEGTQSHEDPSKSVTPVDLEFSYETLFFCTDKKKPRRSEPGN